MRKRRRRRRKGSRNRESILYIQIRRKRIKD